MALMLGMMTPTAVTAEPQVLADRALDAVTASGVLVNVSSVASAIGDHVVADTSSYTSVDGRHPIEVGIGFSDGYATACCGEESDVALDSTAVGAGDRVYGKTYTVEFRGAAYTVGGGFGDFAYGYTAAFLLAVSFEDAFETAKQKVQEPRDDIRGVTDAVREFLGASRDGIATGFELGGAIAAGMRWQAAQDLAAGYWDIRQLPTDTPMSSREIQ
ncbi:MAG: hypothetical protein ACREJ0_13025 [Geminicoccaceae bacterium]